MMSEKQVPNQYKKPVEDLIYEIAQLANKLWVYSSELGDSLEIECKNCKVIIKE